MSLPRISPIEPLSPEPEPLTPEERARVLHRLRAMMRDALAFDCELQNRFTYFAQTGRWPERREP